MAFKTAKEIISEEIRTWNVTAKKLYEKAEKEFFEAQERLNEAERQSLCDANGKHEFEDMGGFTLLEEKCKHCGWVHSV